MTDEYISALGLESDSTELKLAETVSIFLFYSEVNNGHVFEQFRDLILIA